jgi:hypothetical protein
MNWSWPTAALLVSSLTRGAAAAPDDALAGPRSYAMGGAHRAVGTSNDTLYSNPAGLAFAGAYSVELQYGYSKADDLGRYGISAVDSKSGPVAGGAGITHVRGRGNGLNHIYIGAAYPISQALALGFSLHHLRGDYADLLGAKQSVSVFTGDVGVIARLSDSFNIGASYNGAIKTDYPALTPQTLGFGAAAGLAGLTLAADMTLDTEKNHELDYHAGVEYYVHDTFPLRVGYTRGRCERPDGRRPYENLLSAGIGWMTPTGGFELAYRRSLDRSRNWGIVGGLRLLL